MLRVVIDTYVWISAFLNPVGFPGQVERAFVARRFMLVTSNALLDEVIEVVSRNRIASRVRYAASGGPLGLVALMTARGEVVEISGIESICRNSSDDRVIETAIRGYADYIVT